MELMISFECPQCRKTVTHRLNTFHPGELRPCSGCDSKGATFSDTTLRDFSINLRRYCEHPPAV